MINKFLLLLFVAALQIYCSSAEDCSDAGTYSCSSDCTEVLYCTGSNTILVQNCSATNLLCNKADHKCVPPEESDCPAPPPVPFTCTDTGIFPSPTNCSNYLFCPQSGGHPSHECTCKSDEYFDTAKLLCVKGTCDLTTRTARCPLGNDSSCLLGSEETHFYYICLPNDIPLVIFCPNIAKEEKGTCSCVPSSSSARSWVQPRSGTCAEYVVPPTPHP